MADHFAQGENLGGIVGRPWGPDVANALVEAIRANAQALNTAQVAPDDPSEITADSEADPGSSDIPAPEDHVHPVLVGPPSDLGNASAEGTSAALSRADHVHKRDVRVKVGGADVATRNGINFSAGFAATDDGSGTDTVTIRRRTQRFFVFLDPAGARDVTVWRAPYAGTVTAVKGYRVGGTGATVNARRNGTSEHLSGDLSLASAGAWLDGGAVQNTAYAAGDSLELRLKSIAGAVTEVTIQVELTE